MAYQFPQINFDMDLAQPSVIPAIKMMQGDIGRILRISLLNNGEPYDLTDSDELRGIIRYLKPDGTGGSYDTMPENDVVPGQPAVSFRNKEDGLIVCWIAPQVLTVPGIVKLSVDIVHDLGSEFSNLSHIHTFTVEIQVEANPGYQATSEGYYNVRGSLPDSGWTPNLYLGTDANGKVVTVSAPDGSGTGGTGMTDEERAQLEQNTTDISNLKESVQQNREDIDALPVTVTEDGYTDIAGQRQATDIVFTRTDQSIAIDITMQGAIAYNGVLELDENGFPAKYTENGLEVNIKFFGFDDLETTGEGGSL